MRFLCSIVNKTWVYKIYKSLHIVCANSYRTGDVHVPKNTEHHQIIKCLIIFAWSYPTSCMRGQWARLATTAHSSEVPTEVRLNYCAKDKKQSVSVVTCVSCDSENNQSKWVLLNLFEVLHAHYGFGKAIGAFMVNTVERNATNDTELKKEQKGWISEGRNTYQWEHIRLGETYSNTLRCVSDGKMRAILAAVRFPSVLSDRLEECTKRHINMYILKQSLSCMS